MRDDIITTLRQNHALEHATIALLTRKLGLNQRIVGQSTFDGFYIYGNVPSEEIRAAAKEGLSRLQDGDGDLAVSPFCGTNMVVAGALAGVACFLALGGKDRGRKLPMAIVLATCAMAAAQPIGRAVQKHMTTTSSLSDITIKRITRRGSGKRILHKVETARA